MSISIRQWPRDLTIPFFLGVTPSLKVFNAYRLVCKDFKEKLDDPELLKRLLVKFKGPVFQAEVYQKDPRKYLILDHVLTGAFREIISKKKISSNILKKTAFIALTDLDRRLFTIKNASTVTFYRLHQEVLAALIAVNVNDQMQWKECIRHIVRSMKKHTFLPQMSYRGPYADKIVSALLQPNDEMKKLIKEMKIKDVYSVNGSSCVFHAEKVSEELLNAIFQLSLNKEEYQIQSTFLNLIRFLSSGSIVNSKKRFKFDVNEEWKQALIIKLKELKEEQIKIIEDALPQDACKYLLGSLLPGVWPNILDELGENGRRGFDALLLNQFAKSVKIEYSDAMVEAEVAFDSCMQKSILRRLNDPKHSELKEYIEIEANELMLELCKNIFFPEVWDNPPFHDERGCFILINERETRVYLKESRLLRRVSELGDSICKGPIFKTDGHNGDKDVLTAYIGPFVELFDKLLV